MFISSLTVLINIYFQITLQFETKNGTALQYIHCYVSLSVQDVEQHDKDRRRIFDIIYLFN